MSDSVRRSVACNTTPTLSWPAARNSRYRCSVSSVVEESSMSIRTKLPREAASSRWSSRTRLRAADVVAELEAERAQLDAHVRVEIATPDVREHVEGGADD